MPKKKRKIPRFIISQTEVSSIPPKTSSTTQLEEKFYKNAERYVINGNSIIYIVPNLNYKCKLDPTTLLIKRGNVRSVPDI